MSVELKKYNILWIGPIADPSGYGIVSREYLKQLSKYETLNIKIIPKTFHCGNKLHLTKNERELFEKMIDNSFICKLPILTVFHLQPEHYDVLEGCDKHVALTIFETNGIPECWKSKLNLMDEIWTFSNFSKNIFEKETQKDVHIIPHGIDIDKYKPGLSVMPELKKDIENKFVFGSNFSWQPRKNPYVLIEAYLREFINQDNVVLILKVMHCNNEFIKQQIYDIKQKIGINNKFPEIIIITDVIKDELMPNYYCSLDAYVLLSKGEGFSLSHMEAMACGIPAIATNWGGHLDFMNKKNSYLVPYNLSKVSNEDAKQQPIFENQEWAEVKISDAQKYLRTAFKEKKKHKITKKIRSDMLKWTWEEAGKILYGNIERIMNNEKK